MLNSALLQGLQTLPECIDHLLAVREQNKAQYGSYPRLPDAEAALGERWRANLLKAFPVSGIITPGQIAAWWRAQGDPLAPYAQAACLHDLLTCLNDYFRGQEVECYELGNMRLALGRRWWNAREEQPSDDSLAADAPQWSLSDYHLSVERLPFTNLRRIEAPALQVIVDHQPELSRWPLLKKPLLRIALSALSGRAQTFFRGSHIISAPQRIHGFVADVVRHPGDPQEAIEGYLAELRGIVRAAREKRVDVLCFPELCVCPRGRETLQASLTDGEKDDMLFIVAGSYHDDLPPTPETPTIPRRQNRAPIWTLRAGEIHEVTYAEKFEPFGFAFRPSHPFPATLAPAVEMAASESCSKLQEDIFVGKHVALLPSPVGLWGVIICRDAIYPSHESLQALLLLADHLVVISMDKKGADFFRHFAKHQSHFHMCSVYYVNAAQVLGEGNGTRGGGGNEIHAAWSLPSRSTDTTSLHAVEYVTRLEAIPAKAGDSVRPRSGDGLYIVEINHRGLV